MGLPKPNAPALRDLWHVVATSDEVQAGGKRFTTLLGAALTVSRNERLRVARNDDGSLLPVIERYGCIWTSFGSPSGDLFAIAEHAEEGRRNVIAGSIGMQVPAARAIEGFGQLREAGDEFRVLHPYCSALFRPSASDGARADVVAMFCQPLTATAIRVHLMLSLVGDDADAGIGLLQRQVLEQRRWTQRAVSGAPAARYA